MAGVTTRKTPGVYITELPAFPPSIVGVDTAVPAFIGYTEKAEIGGMPCLLQPIEINSMAEFEETFGGAFKAMYNLTEVTDRPIQADKYDFKVLNPTVSPAALVYYKLSAVTVTDFQFEGVEEAERSPVLARYNLYNSMLLYYANGGGRCYVVSVGDYRTKVGVEDLLLGIAAIENQYGPTMLVIPDAVLLPESGTEKPWENFATIAQAMLAQCAKLQDRVAILDVYNSLAVITRKDLQPVIDGFREAVGEKFLNYGMAYFPFLYTTIAARKVNYQNIYKDSFTTLQTILDWEATNLYPPATAETIKTKYIDEMVPFGTESGTDVGKLNDNLVAAVPLLGEIESDIAYFDSVLPPSGAMAGVYKYNDMTRGVWNAPANIALTSVTEPTYLVNADDQANLNVPLDGKAVDALREFIGRGTVVWGARTLDGNSGDYRYIQVRRTLIYIEQSIKLALDQFVFAPNNGTTWATVTAMISSLLQGVWSAGGLLGATPAEAFTVTCGLGSTMTGQDILDGYMRVQVVLQMIRPAEFIELTFQQKMEGAG